MKDYSFSFVQIYYNFIVARPFLNILKFISKRNVFDLWYQKIGTISVYEEDIY
jgi:hypothetical protein